MINLKNIEEKWQRIWEENKVFETNASNKPKFFVTFPYPYVNGLLHLGHLTTSSRVEFIARFKRLLGYNVLFAQGFHATGSPIIAAAYRLREGEEKIKKELIELMHVNEKEIEKFKDPTYWIEYFVPKAKEAFKKLGYSIDWRREFFTTSLNNHYSKFIEWQYFKLREKGFIKRGKHPVIWDPKVKKVIGDHDRPDDFVGIDYIEGYIIKFKFYYKDKEIILPCFTLRPETIYGVTNIWINPNYEYIIAKVNEEFWLLPNSIVIEEIKNQEKNVEVLEKVDIENVILNFAENPLTKEKVPILPANFVDIEIGTGIVMSVPAHAPYDYIGLIDLTKSENKKYKEVAEKCLKNMKSLFKLEGFSEFPAKDIVEKMKISSQNEKEKLEKATEEIYSKEFYNAFTKEIFGEFSNRKIYEIKNEFAEKLISLKIAEKHYTLPIRFESRYKNKVIVKILSDQWFLDYSNEEWKKLALECLSQMKIIPEIARRNFENSIKILREWAFTHKESLGTPLPWDKEWIIESLSDSTIYMAYYTIAHLIKNIDAEKLNEEVFDFIFLGRGNSKEISKKYGIDEKILEEMRKEFVYWYPMDLRISGKDLIPNHLSFMIFHHAAIFPKEYWPKGVGINGFLLINGEKMSKSKGNFIPILDALEKYSADILRFLSAYAGNSGLEDLNIELNLAEKIEGYLKEWYNFCIENYNKGREEKEIIDFWFENVIKKIVKEVENEYENLNFKNIIQKAWFELENKFNKYLYSVNIPNREVLNYYIEVRNIILYPIIPHITSEILEKIGKDPLNISWPKVEKIDEGILKSEEYIEFVISDIREILKIKGTNYKEIKIIVANREKLEIAKKIKEEIDSGKNLNELIKKYSDNDVAKRIIKKPKILNYLVEEEFEILSQYKEFLEKVFKCKITIEKEEESNEIKAKDSLPAKPSIVIIF
ncbi:MAG: leucine--tRNA ligase [Candidatus Aenigmatarchaeota archaeon]